MQKPNPQKNQLNNPHNFIKPVYCCVFNSPSITSSSPQTSTQSQSRLRTHSAAFPCSRSLTPESKSSSSAPSWTDLARPTVKPQATSALKTRNSSESYFSQIGNDEYMAIGIVLCVLLAIVLVFGLFLYDRKGLS
jgi:hypothetical protein